ncbi:hypothetical protein JXB28_05105, partial [Candidatus Woesearchaeota archaeon]|nr:hypothetical protein [Candidatus Woesearchaeota archaeon]
MKKRFYGNICGNRLLWAVMLALIIAMLAGSASALVSVYPSSYELDSCSNRTFSINISLSGVADVYGFQFDLGYNSDILEVVSISSGALLSNNNQYSIFCIDPSLSTPGLIDNVACTRVSSQFSTPSSGLLSTITFRVRNAANYPAASGLVLSSIKLVNSNNVVLSNASQNGQVNVLSCPCVGAYSEEDARCIPTDYYCDRDGDGFFNRFSSGTCSLSGCVPSGCTLTVGTDCFDSDATIHPGAAEICGDGRDQDCDGVDIPCTSQACTDGTAYGQCSVSRPLYCESGVLVNRCGNCGCSSGQSCTSAGTCAIDTQACADGTAYGQCSTTKPRYCSNGQLINSCSNCGCPAGYTCNTDGSCGSSSPGMVTSLASCEQSVVQSGIDSASPGSTILVPAGTCTWNNQLVINKPLIITGAGIDKTIIISGYDAWTSYVASNRETSALIYYNPGVPGENHVFQFSGFTIDCQNRADAMFLRHTTSAGNEVARNIRIHHNKIKNTNATGRMFLFQGDFYGVVDSNIGENVKGLASVLGLNVATWNHFTYDYGTPDQLYFEDNHISGDIVYIVGVSGGGGRWCARYNVARANTTRYVGFHDMHGNQKPGASWHANMGAISYGNVQYSPDGYISGRF